jgi:hypothetical protein
MTGRTTIWLAPRLYKENSEMKRERNKRKPKVKLKAKPKEN